MNGKQKGSAKNIFEDITPSIFKNYSILTPEYIPQQLVARDIQIEEVKNAFVPMFTHGYPKHMILQGKSGTGKTVVVRYVTSQLLSMIDSRNDLNFNIAKVEVNCGKKKTIVRILYEVIRELIVVTGQDTSIPKTGLAVDCYFEKIYDLLNQNNISLILVLDEIDKIDADDLLYNLSRAIGEEIEKGLFINIIMITNDTMFYEDGRLDSRVTSTLDPISLVFPPYDAYMLKEILEQRVDEAFLPGVLDEMVIPLCAALGAQEHGDARRALSLLASAGRIAEINKDRIVTEKHLKEADKNYDRRVMLDVLKDQPWQSKLTLMSIIYQWQMRNFNNRKVSVTTGDVYDQYCLFAERLEEVQLSNQRISGLITELDTMKVIKTTVVNAGRHGRTRKVTLSFDEKEVLQSILDSNDGHRFSKLIETLWGNPINDKPFHVEKLYATPVERAETNLTKFF